MMTSSSPRRRCLRRRSVANCNSGRALMSRKARVDALYDELSLLVRRSQEFSSEIHAGLSLVDYTLLTRIAGNPGTRAADLAALFGLDKSTLSRQINSLVERGLVARAGERPGQ